MGATTDQDLSRTTEIAVAPSAPTEPTASETAPSKPLTLQRQQASSWSLEASPHLLDHRACETCLRAHGRLRGAHVVCDECFERHWDEVEPPTVQVRTTLPDACGCVDPGRSANPDCVVCQGWGRVSLDRLTRILTREVDGVTVPYRVARFMKPAKRPIDFEREQAIKDAGLDLTEDLSKRSERLLLSRPRAAAGDFTRSELMSRNADTDAFLRAAGDAGPSKPRGAPPTTVRDRQQLEQLVLLVKRLTDDALPDNPEKAGAIAGVILLGFLNLNLDRFAEMLHGKRGSSRASLFRLRKRSEQRLLDLLELR